MWSVGLGRYHRRQPGFRMAQAESESPLGSGAEPDNRDEEYASLDLSRSGGNVLDGYAAGG